MNKQIAIETKKLLDTYNQQIDFSQKNKLKNNQQNVLPEQLLIHYRMASRVLTRLLKNYTHLLSTTPQDQTTTNHFLCWAHNNHEYLVTLAKDTSNDQLTNFNFKKFTIEVYKSYFPERSIPLKHLIDAET